MAKQLQLRRGDTDDHATFTGAANEVTIDTDKNTVVVHDGTKVGGYPLASEGSGMENLLTNSGFDVWSNSTLENVGSNLITGWTTTPAHPFETFTTSGANILRAENTTGYGGAYSNAISLTVGKLYQASITASQYGGATHATHPRMGFTSGTAGSDFSPTHTLVQGANTLVFEAAADDNYFYLEQPNGAPCDLVLSAVSVYEVTPGCVAADTLNVDGWSKASGSDTHRESWDLVAGHFGGSYNVQSGSRYSLKITGGTDGTWDTYFNAGNILEKERFAGRTITFGAWVKTDAANQVQLQIYDDGANLSANNTGSSWEWMESTKAVDADTAQLSVGFLVDNTKIAYISQPMLVIGSSIGEGNYTRPKGEIIYFEQDRTSATYYTTGFSDIPSYDLNLEIDSAGAIPKGAKAIMATVEAKDADSADVLTECYVRLMNSNINSTQGIQSYPYGKTNNTYDKTSGTVPCNTNGDCRFTLNATGTSSLSVYMKYWGVQLH